MDFGSTSTAGSYSQYTDATQYTNGSPYTGSSPDTDYTRYTASTNGSFYNMYPNPVAGTVILPCEFVGIGPCDVNFNYDETEAWIEHIIVEHLRDRLPAKAKCWFCDTYEFDVKSSVARNDRRVNFDMRMYHIRDHIIDEGMTANNIRPDFHMLDHLYHHRLITEQRYHEARRWTEVPCPHSQIRHIHPPGYEPPERRRQRENANKVIINHDKDDRRWKRNNDKKKHK